jgi:hypothetical protein
LVGAQRGGREREKGERKEKSERRRRKVREGRKGEEVVVGGGGWKEENK